MLLIEKKVLKLENKLIAFFLSYNLTKTVEIVILLIVININQKLFGKLLIQKKYLITFKT